MRKTRHHAFKNGLLAAVMAGCPFAVSQTPAPVIAPRQHSDIGCQKTGLPGSKQRMAEVAEQLRRNVNGKAVVRNQCKLQGQVVQVEESTEIAEISGCKMIFKTRKRSNSEDGLQDLEFTLYANLAELTTPASVEAQTFAQCKPTGGAVLKVVSRVEPGKKLVVTRRKTSPQTTGNEEADEREAKIARNDLSFFFTDSGAAKKAARALEQAVKLCGGKEWPDEDDLP